MANLFKGCKCVVTSNVYKSYIESQLTGIETEAYFCLKCNTLVHPINKIGYGYAEKLVAEQNLAKEKREELNLERALLKIKLWRAHWVRKNFKKRAAIYLRDNYESIEGRWCHEYLLQLFINGQVFESWWIEKEVYDYLVEGLDRQNDKGTTFSVYETNGK